MQLLCRLHFSVYDYFVIFSANAIETRPPAKSKTEEPPVNIKDSSSDLTAGQSTVDSMESTSAMVVNSSAGDRTQEKQMSSDQVSTDGEHPSVSTQVSTDGEHPSVSTAKEAIGKGPDQSQAAGSDSCDKTVVAGKNPTKTGNKEDSDDDESEITRQQKMFQENPDSYNGAIRDSYSWSQSITDLDIKIFVPQHIRKGKEVQVDVHRKHITARCRMPSGEWNTLIDDDLPWDVDKEQSIWSLEPGKAILVNLEKVQERWWECVLTSEPKINVRKIDASRPMSDLDDEAQAKIEELMYNEHQKRLGLPQSHEKKVHDILRKAWDAEGSPFKGQPFDPTKLNITPDGAMNLSGQ
ncbi:hypothetical protein LSH36_120g15055 [Paralvinella palmiformis]|uniref:CS domain-containing protein n=1 Tax=Paralvinella palmiformis TaxID=53620 RepID=A0AAD9JXV7_9ANNE|nr:hypothetical protein LSH36_120g15055 [Paralvinella palmiformis]